MKFFLRKHYITLILLLLFSLPFTFHIFQPGFFVGDDGEWMIIRSSAFHEALRDGQFPVRWLGRLNHEFGYAVPTFLYPGYLYLTEPLVIAGFSFITSIKIMFAITMIVSGIFTYFWLNKLFVKWAALLGALVYLYTPYHLVDMYSRGSLGELLALAVVPFILWQIERRSIIFSAIGIAGLILSHNILAALVLPVILLYIVVSIKRVNIISVLYLFLFSLGISAFFWIPALTELHYTIFNQTKISNWQNYFSSYAQIGGLPIVILLTAVTILVIDRFSKITKSFLTLKEHIPLFIFFTIVGLVCIFFSSFLSTFLWPILPVSFIQFPFRFLSLEIVSVAFIAAFFLHSFRENGARIFFFFIVCISLAINALPYFTNIKTFNKGEGFYTTNQSTTTTRDEYMPIWVKERPTQRVDRKIEIIKGTGEIKNITVNNKIINFSITAKEKTIVQINKTHWPGWNALIDGKKVPIEYNNAKGLMRVPVSQGLHTVQFEFQETTMRLIADIISLLSLVILFIMQFLGKNIQLSKHNNKK